MHGPQRLALGLLLGSLAALAGLAGPPRPAPVAVEDNPEYQWVDPGPGAGGAHNCANCHEEIYREWSYGGHAHAADGRHFRDLYQGTDRDGRPGVGWGLLTQYPGGAGVCAACHAPTLAEGDPAWFDLGRVQGIAARGVHCDFCHKVNGAGPGPLGLSHGRFNLNLQRPREGQRFFGPLEDPARAEDRYAPVYHRSRYCASCHEGVLFGVAVYTTYSEWRDSPAARAGRQCQDCHMSPTGRMTNVAPGHGGRERDPATLANHRFFRGSKADMLRDCLRVSVRSHRDGDRLGTTVTLWTEGAGHRVPTGYSDRNLILVVEGLNAADRPVPPFAGPVLPAPAGPSLAGQPGRLYAKLLKDAEGHRPAPFWQADLDPEDNRLRPGVPDAMIWSFPPEIKRLCVRILYRRFWHEVIEDKHWPDRDLEVFADTFGMPES